MKNAIAALLACCTLAAGAEPALDLSARPPATPVLTDDMIKKAVRETIADGPRPAPAGNQQAGVLHATGSMEQRMSAAFEEAKVPDCLHEDVLKLQPAHIGPISVVGPLSLPWIVAAVVRGKCR
jgi:hypothetical protein